MTTDGRRLLVGAACVLALAACGSSGGSKSAPAASSTTASTAPADPALAADRRIAAAGLIRTADLPGWQATKRSAIASRTDIKTIAVGMPSCATYAAGVRDGRVRVRSSTFTRTGTTVDENVNVFASAPELQGQLELYRDPAITGCMQAVLTKLLTASAPPGTDVGTVSVSPIGVDPSGADGYGFRVTAALTQNGTPHTILTDLVGVTAGRALASLTVSAPDPAGMAQAETTLLPIVTQRIREAQH